MPMTATLDGERIDASELDDDGWALLRRGHRAQNLAMVCGRRATPKVSKLGLRFFAHAPGDECGLHESGPESAEHQQAKRILADAAAQRGWNATIEAIAPDRSWIADVLLERDGVQVALEVQWSPQSDEVFARRTMRYLESGVRCVWFLGPANHRRDVQRAYRVSGDLDDLYMSSPGLLGEPAELLRLDDAARRLFGGEVRESVELRAEALHIEYFVRRCWRDECGKWYARWYLAGVDAMSRCGRAIRVEIEAGATPLWRPHAPTRPEQRLQDRIRPFLRQHMAEPVRYAWRVTQPVPEGYVGAICGHCGVVQGDGLERDGSTQAITMPWTGPLTWDTEFLSSRAHTCPDIGQGQCQRLPEGRGSSFPPDDVYPCLVTRPERQHRRG